MFLMKSSHQLKKVFSSALSLGAPISSKWHMWSGLVVLNLPSSQQSVSTERVVNVCVAAH